MAVGGGGAGGGHRRVVDPVDLPPVERARSAAGAHRSRARAAAGHRLAAAAVDSRAAGDAAAGSAAGQPAARAAHRADRVLHLVAGTGGGRRRACDPAQPSHRCLRQPGSAPHPDPDAGAQPRADGRHHRAGRIAGAAHVPDGAEDRHCFAGIGRPDRSGRRYRRQAGVRQPDCWPADRGDAADQAGRRGDR
ncbi:hypothetical protein G6F50_014679 [Rhizopus delemar]|uniref:Uncharacterized protein n=1 Tax=Rhizopus delemar TaxID=936053 RepID=A0A9P7C748_9FUNG|nr:hypothetical protein G6F50_014679 [Rhizopus delemar]